MRPFLTASSTVALSSSRHNKTTLKTTTPRIGIVPDAKKFPRVVCRMKTRMGEPAKLPKDCRTSGRSVFLGKSLHYTAPPSHLEAVM
ncbi:hypothetical protein PPTG_24114 [Phytophthora nicotianae INRA-310]|uniref:Uncharacterized protein n=1 Tax=Phytophthora nicotianae (strain INRA-310) TaxID=761204 RepID=W2PJZ5_PHYN3|nr:hypothetical protein PPTG_24114 [Phytophthora nicotianae INRA-310]ETN01177.1 hypothetical protein PPTG_24114 [Phytophthora nicotianae INRA-310]